MVVTACHLGGIGYSLTFQWNLPHLVPVAWVMVWTLYLRRRDFLPNPGRLLEQAWLFIPLLLPMLAGSVNWILPIFASLNLACYVLRFVLRDRSRPALIQLLAAAAILLSGLPPAWLDHAIPALSRAQW